MFYFWGKEEVNIVRCNKLPLAKLGNLKWLGNGNGRLDVVNTDMTKRLSGMYIKKPYFQTFYLIDFKES